MSTLAYKENPERCVYITGRIDDALTAMLFPQINQLRVASNEPITFYIDSLGGDIRAADMIRSLAKAPDPDGNSRELVTVVIGTAASAAADTLILGDYSIAYDHTLIGCHGTRQNPRDDLTYEAATSMASALRQTNEMYALRLARRCFPRLLFAFSQMKELADYCASEAHSIDPLATSLAQRLSLSTGRLVSKAQVRCSEITQMSNYVFDRISKPSKAKSKSQTKNADKEVLDAVIAYKTQQYKGSAWRLSGGIEEVTQDYQVFYDYHIGEHSSEEEAWIHRFGTLLLTDDSLKAHQMLPEETAEEQNEKAEWLMSKVGWKMKQLWYFCVSLARILQTDDFWLQPEEAYWLGLVDEVPGSQLLPLRKLNGDTDKVA